MSFILDALRKVDQDRGPSGDSAPVAISIDQLQEERIRRRRQYGAMAVIAVISAVATAAALRMISRAEAPAIEAASQASIAPEVPDPEPVESTSEPPPVKAATPPAKARSQSSKPSVPEAEPPPEPTEDVPPEVVETELETIGAIRVVGQASPTRSITHTPVDVPEATDPADLPPNFPRLVLQGTSMIDGKPVAVVSDRRVFEGDRIEGATVIRIEERSVELEFEGRRFTLSL